MRIIQTSTRRSLWGVFTVTSLIAGALLLSGCGGSKEAPLTNAASNPQAATQAAQRSVASDAASAQSRAASEQRGKEAAAAQKSGQAPG